MAYAKAYSDVSSPAEISLPPMGSFAFALTSLIFSLGTFAPVSIPPFFLGACVILGGFFQMGVGLFELKKNQIFSAVALTSIGLFWLSLAALLIFPRAGLGSSPEPFSSVSYIGLWALFILGLALGSQKRHLQVLFGLNFLFLVALAGAIATGGDSLQTVAAAFGVLNGIYAAGMAFVQTGARPRTSNHPTPG